MSCANLAEGLLRVAALALVLCASPDGRARCISNDAWRGDDKQLHAIVGAAVGAAGAYGTRDPWAGFWLATGVALAKEALDASGGGTCSAQDAVVTIAAGALGAAAAGWHIRLTERGAAQLAFSRRF